MRDGWIKLHRQLKNCWIWEDKEPFDRRSAWVDLLLLARHSDTKMLNDGEIILIKRGSYMTSVVKLSERWKWSRGKTDRFLKLLEKEQMINTIRTPFGTLVTIVKYDDFQGLEISNSTTVDTAYDTTYGTTNDTSFDTANGQPTDSKRTYNGTTVGTQNKNIKNIENDKEQKKNEKKERMEEYTPPISPSQREEVDEPKTKTKSKDKEPSEDNVHMLNRLSTDYCFSDFLLEKVREWIEYKAARKETYVERGMKSLLTIISGNAQKYGDMAVADVIDLSMASNYKGILWDKISRNNNQQSFSNGGIDWSKV